jgi:hypothetical protein
MTPPRVSDPNVMCAHCVAEKFISGLPLGAHCWVCAKDLLGWTVRATRATRATRAAPARRVDLPPPASCVRPPGLSTPTRDLSQWRISAIWFAMMALEHSRWAGHSPKRLSVRAKGVSKDAKTGETVAQIQCAGCRVPPGGGVIRIQ